MQVTNQIMNEFCFIAQQIPPWWKGIEIHIPYPSLKRADKHKNIKTLIYAKIGDEKIAMIGEHLIIISFCLKLNFKKPHLAVGWRSETIVSFGKRGEKINQKITSIFTKAVEDLQTCPLMHSGHTIYSSTVTHILPACLVLSDFQRDN